MSDTLSLVALGDATRGESVMVLVAGLDDHRGYNSERGVTLTLVAGEGFSAGSVVYQPIPGLAMVDGNAAHDAYCAADCECHR